MTKITNTILPRKPYFKVSKGNIKLGNITNINLPAIITCPKDAPCKKSCYALKGTYCYNVVKNRYLENLTAFTISPIQAESDLLEQLPYYGYVRWHSSGDIVNLQYLEMMVNIAKELPNSKFLAYTKKYQLVNEYLDYHILPPNLNIVFSLWENYPCDNYHILPTTNVELKNSKVENITIQDDAFICKGSCVNCRKCWELLPTKQVLFKQH